MRKIKVITAKVVGFSHIIASDRLLFQAGRVDTGSPSSIGDYRAVHDCSLYTVAACFHIQLASVATSSESLSGNHTRDTVSGRGTALSSVCPVAVLGRSPNFIYYKTGS